MEIQIETADGCTIARLRGPLDEAARGPFREQLHPLVAVPGTKLIVDLTGAPRVNSAGIGNLVALVADANTNGNRVVLCNLQPYVSVVISVTKLDKYFELAADAPAAAAQLSQPRAAPG